MKTASAGIFILALALWGGAQAITGTILGNVTDESGAVLPGVTITVVSTATNLTRTTVTNESGNYSVPTLPVGSYRVEAELPGFKKEVHTGITLQVDQRARIDIVLKVGQITEVLEVTSEAPLVQTDDSSVGAVIDEKKVLELPLNGRQFESLVQLVPGAVTPAQGSHLGSRGGFNIAGMDEHYNSFFLDGIDNVDPVIRNFSFRPSVDLIQEFKVQESGYGAEFGRNAGAVINVTTKSGTNEFHGAAWEFIRNDDLDARNFFALKEFSKPPLNRNQFGATLGGPLKKDKTFFFAAYEGLRLKRGETRRASVPTERMRTGDLGEYAAAVRDPQTGQPFPGNRIPANRIHAISRAVLAAYPAPNISGAGLARNRVETSARIENGDDISFKVDHSLTEGTRMMARYSFSDTENLDAFRSETGGGANLANFGQIADRIRTNIGVSFVTVKGANFVNDFRAGYNRFNQPQIPVNAGPDILRPLHGFVKTFLPFSISGFDPIGSGGEFKRIVNVYNYIDNLSYSTGNHQFKLGVDVRRYLFNAFTIGPNNFTFDGSKTGNAFADFLLGLPVRTTEVTGAPGGNPRKTELAWFVQDDWKVNSRLTLNYGLRWEWYGRVSEKINKQSMWVPSCNCMQQAGQGLAEGMVNNDNNNFAPRLGFAWRPFGDDRTVIRGGGGIFYDSDMRHNFELIGNPPFVLNRTHTAANLTMDNPFPSSTAAGTLSANAFPVNYPDTYAKHWNFGIQREISSGLLVDMAYVSNHTLKARRNRNVNQPINGVRPYPTFGNITMAEQVGYSIFHSLQTRVEKRFAQGLSFISSYTWGHAIDNRPGQGGGAMQNAHNPGLERGDSDFDVRHRLTVSYVYELPVGRGRRFGSNWPGAADAILGGWGLNGIVMFQGGRPFTVTLNQDRARLLGGGSNRPNRVAGADLAPSNQGPDGWINRAAFELQPAGAYGTAGRNIGRGPQMRNADFSLVKNNQVSERFRLQFRAEFFNLTNHPNFGLPAAAWDAGNFGVISSTITNERQIQFGLRIEY